MKDIEIVISNKDRIMIFAPIFFVIIFTSFFFKCEQTSEADFYQYVVPAEYHGIIIEKHTSNNHAEPFVQYDCEGIINEMSCFNWYDVYENSEIGDSIYKIKGDSVMYLKKKKDLSILKIYYFFDKGWSIVKRKW